MTEWKRELHDVLEVDKSGEGDEGSRSAAGCYFKLEQVSIIN